MSAVCGDFRCGDGLDDNGQLEAGGGAAGPGDELAARRAHKDCAMQNCGQCNFKKKRCLPNRQQQQERERELQLMDLEIRQLQEQQQQAAAAAKQPVGKTTATTLLSKVLNVRKSSWGRPATVNLDFGDACEGNDIAKKGFILTPGEQTQLEQLRQILLKGLPPNGPAAAAAAAAKAAPAAFAKSSGNQSAKITAARAAVGSPLLSRSDTGRNYLTSLKAIGVREQFPYMKNYFDNILLPYIKYGMNFDVRVGRDRNAGWILVLERGNASPGETATQDLWNAFNNDDRVKEVTEIHLHFYIPNGIYTKTFTEFSIKVVVRLEHAKKGTVPRYGHRGTKCNDLIRKINKQQHAAGVVRAREDLAAKHESEHRVLLTQIKAKRQAERLKQQLEETGGGGDGGGSSAAAAHAAAFADAAAARRDKETAEEEEEEKKEAIEDAIGRVFQTEGTTAAAALAAVVEAAEAEADALEDGAPAKKRATALTKKLKKAKEEFLKNAKTFTNANKGAPAAAKLNAATQRLLLHNAEYAGGEPQPVDYWIVANAIKSIPKAKIGNIQQWIMDGGDKNTLKKLLFNFYFPPNMEGGGRRRLHYKKHRITRRKRRRGNKTRRNKSYKKRKTRRRHKRKARRTRRQKRKARRTRRCRTHRTHRRTRRCH